MATDHMPTPQDPNMARNPEGSDTSQRRTPPPSENDLTDPPSDRERLTQEVSYIDLPEVKDIPGQENFQPLPLGELADTTISSDDEENLVNDDSDDLDDLDQSGVPDEDEKIV